MTPTQFREGDALDAAISAQIEKLKAALNVQEAPARLAGVTAHAAILQALVSADSSSRVDASLRSIVNVSAAVATSVERVGASVTVLKQAADDFTAATAASEKTLTFWTKVQGGAALALTFFTLVQVVIAVLEYLRPAQ